MYVRVTYSRAFVMNLYEEKTPYQSEDICLIKSVRDI